MLSLSRWKLAKVPVIRQPTRFRCRCLDFGGVPAEGWPNFLGRRAMPMIPDSLGRDSVSHSHARQLLDEAREAELRRRKRVAILQAEQDGISSEPPRFGGAAR